MKQLSLKCRSTLPKHVAAACVAVVFGSLINAAGATDDNHPEQRVGHQTEAWLNLQASGAQATDADRPLTGPVAERIYQRYLDSFSYPIPEQFPRESFSSDND